MTYKSVERISIGLLSASSARWGTGMGRQAQTVVLVYPYLYLFIHLFVCLLVCF